MSLSSRVSDLAAGIGNYIRDSILPRVLPSGGSTGSALTKSSNTNYATQWTALGTGAAKNIHVGSTPPSSPQTGDIWVDTASTPGGGGGGSSAPDVSTWPILVASFGGNWTLNAGGFNTIPILSVTDSHSAFNDSTHIYTIPDTGVYEIHCKLRTADNHAIVSLGLGAGTSNSDTPAFRWSNTMVGASYNRNGHINTLISAFNQGDQVRMYAYIESTQTVTSAEMAVMRIR